MADQKCRVAFDIQNDNIASGIGQYTRHIANGLVADGYDIVGVLHKKSSRGFDFPIRRSGISHRYVYDSRLFAAVCPVSYEKLVGVEDCDCIVFPNNTMPGIPVKRPVVALIHDLLPIRIDRFMAADGHGPSWSRAYERRYRRIVDRADVICTISEYTKQDIIRTYGVSEDRFCLVPPGADLCGFSTADPVRDAEVKRRLGLPDRYVLYVGADRAYKNVDGLIRGFAAMPAEVRERTWLVLSHGEGKHGALVERLRLAGRVRFLGGIAEADKASVYRLARAFAFLSYFEGFGMPALEAMAAKVPVLVSDRASLPEVVGDAGLVVSPDDDVAIGNALVRLLEDEELRTRSIAAGDERARAFTWENSVACMQTAIDRAVRGK